MYLVALLAIAGLLVLSIAWAGRTQGRLRALQALLAALACAVAYELAVEEFRPAWNIRVEFALVPLFLVALARVVFPPPPPCPAAKLLDARPEFPAEAVTQAAGDSEDAACRSTSPVAGRSASRCLTLGLVNVVFWMLPVLAIPAIYFGHRALLEHPTNADRRKAMVGLLVAYPQVLAAAYLWFLS